MSYNDPNILFGGTVPTFNFALADSTWVEIVSQGRTLPKKVRFIAVWPCAFPQYKKCQAVAASQADGLICSRIEDLLKTMSEALPLDLRPEASVYEVLRLDIFHGKIAISIVNMIGRGEWEGNDLGPTSLRDPAETWAHFATKMENRVLAGRRATQPMDDYDLSHGQRIARLPDAKTSRPPILVPASAVAFVRLAEEHGATPLAFRDYEPDSYSMTFASDAREVVPYLMDRAGFEIHFAHDGKNHFRAFRASTGVFCDRGELDAFLRSAWRNMEADRPKFTLHGQYLAPKDRPDLLRSFGII